MRAWFLCFVLLLLPDLSDAQTATLVADRVTIEGESALIAEGNVEVYYEDARLTARRIRYDREDESLSIEGPLVLSQGDGTIVLASSADLDRTLRNGVLRSARIVLDRQLQLAAAQIDRADDRFTRLSRVRASSCEICEDGRAPLWEIRARRVIRDELERQLYFEDAQLRVIGLPVFYLPQMRLPDPTVKRANGFVVPSIRSRSGLGTGIRIPYFLTIGDHADITFAPYISGATRTLESTYRHELPGGGLRFDAAISRDDLRPGDTRGYIFAEGIFQLPRDFKLGLDLELVSDDTYLSDYDYSLKDRLASGLTLSRVRDDQQIRAEATAFRTLRARELPNDQLVPNELLEFQFDQRLLQDPVWGQAWLELGGISLSRPSDAPFFGRDVNRLSAAVDWNTSYTFQSGIVGRAEARLAYDLYGVDQDPTLPDNPQRVTPAASLSLSWPFEQTGDDGARHLLTPTVQLAWAENYGDRVPNEDSTVVEFDEANLFWLSRYPGVDRYETGLRANLGVTWTRYDPSGWSLGLTVGRVLRFDDKRQFAIPTGLSGGLSEWLIAANFRLDQQLHVLSRTLFEDNLDVSRSETRVTWRKDTLGLSGTYIWRKRDITERRFEDLSELTLAGAYGINDFWTTAADIRYDIDASTATRAGVGVRYQNECIGMDLSVSRRLTSSSSVDPVTDFDFEIFLTGFGTGGSPSAARRRCNG